MSIESTKATAAINTIAATQDMRTRSQTQNNEPSSAGRAKADKTEVTLSAMTKQIQTNDSRDVNYARVAEIRAALAAGEMPIEPEKIAQSLVQELFQF